eukprot:gene7461-gene11212
MNNRIVLNKYFPADFDPKLIPKRSQTQTKVKLMLPFNIICVHCNSVMYKGKIVICSKDMHRFSFKCSNCSTDLTMFNDNNEMKPEH